jgi:hypothetical protein
MRKKCEMEMFVSYSEHQTDGGCLIALPSYHNNHQSIPSSATGPDPCSTAPVHGYTSVSSHGRASSQFTIPSLRNGKTLTVSQLMRGIATASVLCHSLDLLLFIVILHCRLDLVSAILSSLQSLSHHQAASQEEQQQRLMEMIQNFCLSRDSLNGNEAARGPQYQPGEGELNEKAVKFVKWINGTRKRTIQEVAGAVETLVSSFIPSSEPPSSLP